MALHSHANWKTLTGVSILSVVGAMSFCRMSDGCWTPNEIANVAVAGKATAVASLSGGQRAVQTSADKRVLALKPKIETPRKVEHANASNFQEIVIRSDVPVLVDFYADWCGPCQMIAPVLEQLAEESPSAKVVKINVDHSPQLASAYGVSSIPALLVFDDGQLVKQHVGLASLSSLKQMLKR